VTPDVIGRRKILNGRDGELAEAVESIGIEVNMSQSTSAPRSRALAEWDAHVRKQP
jgi:hypothetical protein